MIDGEAIKKLLLVFTIILFLVGVFFYGAFNESLKRISHTDNIESTKPIIPIKKLVINNNKVDTIYIYQQP